MKTTFTQKQKFLMMFILLLGSFLTTLAETLLNNALPAIMSEMRVTQLSAQWLSTGYFLVAGITMPTAAYFTNRVNLKPLFVSIMSIFLLGLIISATANSFLVLLIGRMVQAISVGISMPLVQNVLTLIFPVEKRGFILGIAGVVISLGPAVGPTLSGVIVDHYSWRMLFIFLIPVAVLALLLGNFFIKNITPTKPDKLDVPSVLMSTVGFGSLLYGFSNIGVSTNFNSMVLVTIVLGLVIVGFFVYRQLHIEHPLLELRVFLAPSFRKVIVLASLAAISLMGPELIVPLYNQNIRGLDATTSGLTLLIGALLMAVISLISGKLYDLFGIKKLAYYGFGLAIMASIPMLWFNQTTSPIWIAIVYAIRISSLTLVYMPISVLGLNALPQKYVVYGSTIIVTIQQLATSLGTALLVAITAWGSKFGLRHGLVGKAADTVGYKWAFIVTLVITILCLIVSFKVKNRTKVEI
ncbi:DHA2 family efflux MFS transporter permease subunit [Companilactobacillus kimchiensis]|uniref:Drug resistance MFS transporter, drug H+ antiporter-2 family n=1 Tax=Companilactobacillus kimchiensis TaxID=993692 RepID=A0A0R2LDZ4_9LACO|nr:DHA2 family efflux MFS transporter permease subunit [Companilactobacillus kimchiensis]KRO00127.1 drug resistance MFS transporter, drug H+ antiporter-2 family [Companilactobacillus kimchiensis]